MSLPSRAPRRSSLAALAAIAALLLGALAGCSDDDGGGTSEATSGNPWADACRAVIDERDAALVTRGREASLTLITANVQGKEVSTDDLATVADDITALRDHLADTRERLAAVEVDGATADDAAAWDEVVASVDELLGELDTRIDAAESGDLSAVELGEGSTTGVDVESALAQLDLVGRDCEVVYDHPGHSDDERDFVEQASAACAAVVDRRRESGFDQDSTVVEALVEVMQDGAIADPDPVAAALDDAIAEWTATRDDLAAVDAGDAADRAAWDEVVALAEDRLDAAEVRAAALESGDADEIAAAFEPGALIDIPGFTLDGLGLEYRDCRSIGN